jgi:hypothetical protein
MHTLIPCGVSDSAIAPGHVLVEHDEGVVSTVSSA